MGIITWIAEKFGSRSSAVVPSRRSFAAGRLDRLTASWNVSQQSADSAIRFALPVMRSRSRDLAENNDYVSGYLELLRNKIIGAKGIRLQAKSRGGDGKYDSEANKAIEAEFTKWSRRGSCDVTGSMSWIELQGLALESMARDGEVFVRIIKQRGINRHHIALQCIEADIVDINKNGTAPNGNQIRMGVEINDYGKPVAYWAFEHHPGDYAMGNSQYVATVRIPAEEMVHLYRKRRPGQTRGVPWTSAVMTRLHHMGAYEEAAIINARTGASKMGFFTQGPDAGTFNGDGVDPATGNLISEVEPGMLELLPPGYDFKSFDPAYPSNEFDSFIKRQLKGASCGLPGATYADMSNDLESVNFSSIRQGTLNARDSYRTIQQLIIDVLCIPVFEAWLGQALDFGCIVISNGKRGPNSKLSPANYEKYNAPMFVGRGWDWVDPLKDQQANTEALNNNLTTRSRIAAECGDDFEDILAERAQEKELADQYGIDLDPVEPAPPAPEPPPEDPQVKALTSAVQRMVDRIQQLDDQRNVPQVPPQINVTTPPVDVSLHLPEERQRPKLRGVPVRDENGELLYIDTVEV